MVTPGEIIEAAKGTALTSDVASVPVTFAPFPASFEKPGVTYPDPKTLFEQGGGTGVSAGPAPPRLPREVISLIKGSKLVGYQDVEATSRYLGTYAPHKFLVKGKRPVSIGTLTETIQEMPSIERPLPKEALEQKRKLLGSLQEERRYLQEVIANVQSGKWSGISIPVEFRKQLGLGGSESALKGGSAVYQLQNYLNTTWQSKYGQVASLPETYLERQTKTISALTFEPGTPKEAADKFLAKNPRFRGQVTPGQVITAAQVQEGLSSNFNKQVQKLVGKLQRNQQLTKTEQKVLKDLQDYNLVNVVLGYPIALSSRGLTPEQQEIQRRIREAPFLGGITSRLQRTGETVQTFVAEGLPFLPGTGPGRYAREATGAFVASPFYLGAMATGLPVYGGEVLADIGRRGVRRMKGLPGEPSTFQRFVGQTPGTYVYQATQDPYGFAGTLTGGVLGGKALTRLGRGVSAKVGKGVTRLARGTAKTYSELELRSGSVVRTDSPNVRIGKRAIGKGFVEVSDAFGTESFPIRDFSIELIAEGHKIKVPQSLRKALVREIELTGSIGDATYSKLIRAVGESPIIAEGVTGRGTLTGKYKLVLPDGKTKSVNIPLKDFDFRMAEQLLMQTELRKGTTRATTRNRIYDAYFGTAEEPSTFAKVIERGAEIGERRQFVGGAERGVAAFEGERLIGRMKEFEIGAGAPYAEPDVFARLGRGQAMTQAEYSSALKSLRKLGVKKKSGSVFLKELYGEVGKPPQRVGVGLSPKAQKLLAEIRLAKSRGISIGEARTLITRQEKLLQQLPGAPTQVLREMGKVAAESRAELVGARARALGQRVSRYLGAPTLRMKLKPRRRVAVAPRPRRPVVPSVKEVTSRLAQEQFSKKAAKQRALEVQALQSRVAQYMQPATKEDLRRLSKQEIRQEQFIGQRQVPAQLQIVGFGYPAEPVLPFPGFPFFPPVGKPPFGPRRLRRGVPRRSVKEEQRLRRIYGREFQYFRNVMANLLGGARK
ncbi:MAG: hypothetical protein V3U92_19665 [Cellulophaga sp.]